MDTLYSFNALQKFFDIYNVSRLADLTLTKDNAIGFNSKKEYEEAELQAYIKSLLEVFNRLIENPEHYRQNKASIILEWIDMMKTILDVQEGIIKIVASKITIDEDEEVSWFLKFSIYSVQELLERGKKEINRQRGLVRQRRKNLKYVRHETVYALQTISYYCLKILMAAYNVKKKKEEPALALQEISESLYQTKNFE